MDHSVFLKHYDYILSNLGYNITRIYKNNITALFAYLLKIVRLITEDTYLSLFIWLGESY